MRILGNGVSWKCYYFSFRICFDIGDGGFSIRLTIPQVGDSWRSFTASIKARFFSLSLFCLLPCFSRSAFGITKDQADISIQTYNSTFWNASNKTFYKRDNKSGQLDYWMWAHSWETEMDAYERTKDPAYLQKIKDTYTGFIAKNGANGTRPSTLRFRRC